MTTKSDQKRFKSSLRLNSLNFKSTFGYVGKGEDFESFQREDTKASIAKVKENCQDEGCDEMEEGENFVERKFYSIYYQFNSMVNVNRHT